MFVCHSGTYFQRIQKKYSLGLYGAKLTTAITKLGAINGNGIVQYQAKQEEHHLVGPIYESDHSPVLRLNDGVNLFGGRYI